MSENSNLQASLSILAMSVAGSAAVALGLTPNPQDGKTSVDKRMARFHIDLLSILQEKTKGNLSPDESSLIDGLISDLQVKYLTLK